MNSTLSKILLLAFSLLPTQAFADPLRPDHPLIGTWKITTPDGSCQEIYRMRSNGTSLVTSAEEVTESEFSISDQPSPQGFYKWVDKITKDNGKKDCMGEIMEVGHVVTNYIIFNPEGSVFLMCREEDMNACIGPFIKTRGGDI